MTTPMTVRQMEIAPGITLPLVYVPAGEFIMGDDARHDPEAWDNEVPRRRVYLDGYWIGQYPVTIAQYTAYLRATGQPIDPEWQMQGRAAHPVTPIIWREAAAFCAWAGGVTSLPFALPSEAQWEKAARGTDGRRFPWGMDAPDTARCNFGNWIGGTTPVGARSTAGDSPYGCADMAGNVWEWCADWYARDYYRHAPARNPSGPASGSARVLRGGSFADGSWVMRCAFRSWLSPAYTDRDPGFRVVVNEGG